AVRWHAALALAEVRGAQEARAVAAWARLGAAADPADAGLRDALCAAAVRREAAGVRALPAGGAGRGPGPPRPARPRPRGRARGGLRPRGARGGAVRSARRRRRMHAELAAARAAAGPARRAAAGRCAAAGLVLVHGHAAVAGGDDAHG